MSGKKIGYIRVSTEDQNPDRQLEGMQLDKKFIDYASGSSTNRPQLASLMEYVRDEDLVVVHSLDRLARNVKDLRRLIDEFVSKRVGVHFVKENLIFNGDSSPMSNLLLSVIGAVAEFEHSLIRERIAEGIAIAKRNGKYKGKKSKFTKENEEKIREYMATERTKTRTKMAKELGIGRGSLYLYMDKVKQQQANGNKTHAGA